MTGPESAFIHPMPSAREVRAVTGSCDRSVAVFPDPVFDCTISTSTLNTSPELVGMINQFCSLVEEITSDPKKVSVIRGFFKPNGANVVNWGKLENLLGVEGLHPEIDKALNEIKFQAMMTVYYSKIAMQAKADFDYCRAAYDDMKKMGVKPIAAFFGEWLFRCKDSSERMAVLSEMLRSKVKIDDAFLEVISTCSFNDEEHVFEIMDYLFAAGDSDSMKRVIRRFIGRYSKMKNLDMLMRIFEKCYECGVSERVVLSERLISMPMDSRIVLVERLRGGLSSRPGKPWGTGICQALS